MTNLKSQPNQKDLQWWFKLSTGSTGCLLIYKTSYFELAHYGYYLIPVQTTLLFLIGIVTTSLFILCLLHFITYHLKVNLYILGSLKITGKNSLTFAHDRMTRIASVALLLLMVTTAIYIHWEATIITSDVYNL